MKKKTLLTIILAASFVVSSIVFVTSVMVTTGFSEDVYWGFTIGGAVNAPIDKEQGIFETTEEFNNLDVKITSSYTIIKSSDTNETRVILKTNGGDRVKLEAEVRDDTLYVSEKWTRIVGFQWTNTSVRIEIEVPEKQYNNVSIQVTSGDVNTSEMLLDCEKLNVKVTSGDVVYTGEVGAYDINVTSGDVALYGAVGRGNIEVTSGDVKVRYAEWNDALRLKLTSGDVRVELPPESGIRMSSKVTSGDIRYAFGDQSGKIGKVDNVRFGGDNEQSVNINMTSGDIWFGYWEN
ncbi:MAG: DUF4097 domain-containing protein [Oscillospiraceae bacterium]|nr:DUF4097 domain-containing protein [Oscillospiraceae bacterium]